MSNPQAQYILVTGGAGFIGSHLAEALLAKHYNVVVPYIEIDSRSYFKTEKLYKNVVLQRVDIKNPHAVLDLFKKYAITYVFHLAAQTLVTVAYKDPYETLNTNIMGTVNILEAVRLHKSIRGVIFASSDKAYGKTDKPYTENFPLKGDHPYDVSKSSADLIVQAYYKTYAVPVVITRFGNIYGEGDLHMDRIIPGICESIIKRETLQVRSDGNFIRDYIYVKDVVNGYITLLKNIDKIHGEAFNFSSKENLSVLALIRKAEKTLGVKIPYKILNVAKNEIPYQHLVDKKARKLGWKNNYSIESTLPEVLKWYKKNV